MDAAGDFRDYVLARRRALLRTAWLLTGDWQTAEDLVQTALMRCYPKWTRIEPGAADAYVRRTMINVHSSWWRRKWNHERPTETLPDRVATTDEYADADLRQLLVGALGKLPPRQRAAVVLRFYEDLSEADTAAALGCSIGTVKSQTSKALATLRSCGVVLADSHEQEVTP